MTTCSEALRLILDSVEPLPARPAPLFDALGLVLAGRVVSPETVPPFTNSAMDGYAVRAGDCAGAAPGAPVSLEVLADLPAGSVATDEVRAGTAIRIMTGAPLPAGADSVVPVEATESGGGRVRIAARTEADVIVTNGGISVGDYDFVKAVLGELGAREVFWKVLQKPGGPLGYWLLDGKPVFGIPGNTVAAMVCTEEYVRPALRKMMGCSRLLRPEVTATFEGRFKKSAPDGKVHLVRVRARREGGRVIASPSGPQGSGILTSMLRSNALALVPADALALETGDEVTVHLIEEPEDR